MSKELYEKPVAEALEVLVGEGVLVISGGGNITNASEENYGQL